MYLGYSVHFIVEKQTGSHSGLAVNLQRFNVWNIKFLILTKLIAMQVIFIV